MTLRAIYGHKIKFSFLKTKINHSKAKIKDTVTPREYETSYNDFFTSDGLRAGNKTRRGPG
jgi:hypothetical protein